MKILDRIISAIQFGVDLLRAHRIEVHEKVEDVKAEIETDVFGPMSQQEVNAFLATAVKSVPDAKNYATSIVDLMKVLRLDSSLEARKELAVDLGYKGKRDGSAEMNEWLHDEVMAAVADRIIR